MHGAALLLALTGCEGGPLKRFDAGAFAAAQSSGGRILLQFSSFNCAFCRGQAMSLETVLGEPEFRDVVAFKIDFEEGQRVVGPPAVRALTTLVVFKGPEERARDVGATGHRRLRDLLRQAR